MRNSVGSDTISYDDLSSDIIWGGKAIGEEVNLDEKKALYHLERGNLPGQKVGGLWVSTRRQLRAKILGRN